MDIAIIGANGFVGSVLAARAQYAGWKVSGYYNINSGNIPLGCNKVPVRAIHDDVADYDVIFICIGNYKITREQHEEHTELASAILNKWRTSRIVFVSSVAVYGKADRCIDHLTRTAPINFYGESRLKMESLVSMHASYAIARFTYLYGIGMDCESLIPRLVHDAIENKEIRLAGDGSRKQDYLHIDDAVRLLLRLAQMDGNENLIGATGISVTNRQVASIIADAVGDVRITLLNNGDNGVSFSYDPSETSRITGWYPECPVFTELPKYVAHAMAGL